MANRYLLPVYKEIYEKDFDYSKFENRLEMQKAVYLLQEMGVPIGDYGFRLYLHGPYSQSLQDDMYYENGSECAILNINKEYADNIKKLHDIVNSNQRDSYSVDQWVECLASIQYLRRNIVNFLAEDKDVIRELEQRKDHLKNEKANTAACHLLKTIFS